MRQALARLMFVAGSIVATVGNAPAADLGVAVGSLTADAAGVECESPAAAAFPSVWLGHFTGGYSRDLGPGLPVVLDWRDEKLCFPSRRTCDRYIRIMRRDFHRPEGYFTCLPIR